jgi:hypothetical protein
MRFGAPAHSGIVGVGIVSQRRSALLVSLMNALDLLVQADHELYRAKERGRNRVEVTTYDGTRHQRDAASPLEMAPA